MMKMKVKFGILIVLTLLAIVSVASAALPTSVQATASYPYTGTSYWKVVISSTNPVGNTELPVHMYVGWCSDVGHVWQPDGNTFTPYSTLTPVPSVIPTANWSAINYIINHKGSYDWKVIQAVIWHYDGWGHYPGQTGKYPTHWSIEPYSRTSYDNLLAQVEANAGSTYVPGAGKIYGVILWQKENNQAIFVEANIDDIVRIPPPPVPEFPSVALPAAMMVGMVGAVYFIKGRDN
jgi:hypothetical protein